MNLRNIRRFMILAQELHFGRAAEKMHMTQPPLSLSIQQLEKDLGIQLFKRDNKTVVLTLAGTVFYHEARNLLQQTERMKALASRVARGIEGQLNIGFMGSMLFRGLAKSIKDFQMDYPAIDIRLHELNTLEQLKALRHAQLDLAVTHSVGNVPIGMKSTTLLREPFICCLPKAHPLAREACIDLRMLAIEPFLIFAHELSPHYHNLIISLCITAGFSPTIQHEVRHWLTIITLVAEGLGVALVPRSLHAATGANVVFLPLMHSPIYAETLGIWRQDEQSPMIEHFVERIAFAEHGA